MHKGEAFEDDVEEISIKENFVTSNNEEQVLDNDLVEHLNENSIAENEDILNHSKLESIASYMAIITFIDKDLLLCSHPHNNFLYVVRFFC